MIDKQYKSIKYTERAKRRKEVPLHYRGNEAWPFLVLCIGLVIAFLKVLFE